MWYESTLSLPEVVAKKATRVSRTLALFWELIITEKLIFFYFIVLKENTEKLYKQNYPFQMNSRNIMKMVIKISFIFRAIRSEDTVFLPVIALLLWKYLLTFGRNRFDIMSDLEHVLLLWSLRWLFLCPIRVGKGFSVFVYIYSPFDDILLQYNTCS